MKAAATDDHEENYMAIVDSIEIDRRPLRLRGTAERDRRDDRGEAVT